MLALVVIGILCGHKGYTSIATWAREQPELKKALGFTHKKTPYMQAQIEQAPYDIAIAHYNKAIDLKPTY